MAITLYEYIEYLNKLAEQYGPELEMIDEMGEPMAYPEYDADPESALVVASQK